MVALAQLTDQEVTERTKTLIDHLVDQMTQSREGFDAVRDVIEDRDVTGLELEEAAAWARRLQEEALHTHRVLDDLERIGDSVIHPGSDGTIEA